MMYMQDMFAEQFTQRQYVPQSLRAYQDSGVDAIIQSWDTGAGSVLIVMATGGGKTTVMAETLRQVFNPETQRVLIIAHTEEIITQIYDRVVNQFDGALDRRYAGCAGIGVVMGKADTPDARLVIATRQSLHEGRLPKLLQHGKFDFLVVDEAHHAHASNTYGQIFSAVQQHNPDLRTVGFTATPLRTDHIGLGTIFDDIPYEWSIEDGIESQYLVPATRISIATSVDVSGVASNRGDFNQKKLVSVLKTANWLQLCMDAYNLHVLPTGRKTLGFLPSVEMSQQFTDALRAQGVIAEHVDGDTPKEERRAILRDYKRGNIQVVNNMQVLTEGFDAPETGCIFLARPTRSRTLFTQIVGRGLRPFPNKIDCLLVDLSVHDTKALTYGTLLGTLCICEQCRAEYYVGFPACPHCGFVPEKPEKQPAKPRNDEDEDKDLKESDMVGGRLIAQYGSLFEKAFAAWYSGDNYFTTSVGDEGSLVILPPLEDDYYRLVRLPKDSGETPAFINRNEDLSSLLLDADQAIARAKAKGLSDKGAAWRNRPASEAQLQWMKSLGGDPFPGIRQGDASGFITHALVMKRIRKYEDKLRKL